MGHSLSGDIKKEIDDVEKKLFTCIQKVPCTNVGINVGYSDIRILLSFPFMLLLNRHTVILSNSHILTV